MTTGPGDPTPAAPDGYGYARLRASRADRERAIGTLKAAFVQGRLTKDELEERVGRALVPLTGTGSRRERPASVLHVEAEL